MRLWGSFFLLILCLPLITDISNAGQKKNKAKAECARLLPRILSDAERTPSLLLLSNREWWNYKHPFPEKLITKLRKRGIKFAFLANTRTSYPENLARESNISADDVIIYSDEFSSSVANNWTRDLGPHTVQLPDGSRALLFPKPLDESGYVTKGQAVFEKKLSEASGLKSKNIDLVYQGGHVVPISGGRIAISEAVLELNTGETKASIKKKFTNALQGPVQLVWFPPAPGEPTQHIDLFLKDLGNGKLLISKMGQILYEENKGRSLGNSLNEFFDEQRKNLESIPAYLDMMASRFTDLGYEVSRLENPPASLGSQGTTHFSYANSLIIGNLAILPSYGMKEWDRKAKAFYESHGFEVETVDMKSVIHFFGSVHCATCEIN